MAYAIPGQGGADAGEVVPRLVEPLGERQGEGFVIALTSNDGAMRFRLLKAIQSEL
jgi:hypothetical protein